MSQKFSKNYSDIILKKLKEADILLVKEYELFLSGKNVFFNSKYQILNDLNKYYNDLKEAFENEYKKNLNVINNYIIRIEKEFNTIDELLKNNKRIINKGINYMNILMNQNFFEVKLSEQLELMEELKLNDLLDDNINNKINLLLYQIKNNLLIPQINIDNKVIELVQQINSCFSIKINDKLYNTLNFENLKINNILEEKNDNNNNTKSLTRVFMNNNSIYLEEENNEIKNKIEEICQCIDKMGISPNFIWFEPNSNNVYDISLNNNKLKAEIVNYNYVGNNINNNSILFNEDFRVSNIYNNLLYITGGRNNNNEIINETYEYSINKKELIKKSSMNQKRIDHGTIIIGNDLYVCGGTNEKFNSLDTCEKFSISENKWIFISPMKEKLSKINLIQIDNKTFAVFGGLKDNKIFNYKIHYYRVDTNNWFILDNIKLPNGLIYPGLCKLSPKFILILGGINENNEESNEIFKMDILMGNIEKMNNYLDSAGFCTYSNIHSNNEIQLLLNHRNQKYPERIVVRL